MQSLNFDYKLKDRGWSNASTSSKLPRHRWYFFKEGFSSELVKQAILESGCGGKDLIVDPFNGSGTVTLTAATQGIESAGFEVNPFSAFLAKTKLSQVSERVFNQGSIMLLEAVSKVKRSPLEGYSTFSKDGDSKLKKWLFNADILRAFESGWSQTNSSNQPLRNLLRLALISAAMDSCNAVRDGKCLRYRADWKKLKFDKDDFKSFLEEKLQAISDDLKSNPVKSKSSIYVGDARKTLKSKLHKKFKLCVTSPPYLNSFDYTDIYRPELFLGKFISDSEQMKNLRLRTLRSHVQVSWSQPNSKEFGPIYEAAIRKLNKRKNELWSQKIPVMIQAYFEDMQGVLEDLYKKAAYDAQLWIVVSTSAYAGVEIPVDLILADIGSKVGWQLQEVGVLRQLRSASQHYLRTGEKVIKPHLRESVIIFRRQA